MRCFIAADISEEAKDHLFDIENKIAAGRFAKIHFVHKKNIHATLKFLGEVDGGKVELVKEALRKIKFKKFKVKLRGMGFFPDTSKPRVVWIGLDPPAPLMELQQSVDMALADEFPAEQTFRAHITIGRVKFVKRRTDLIEHLELVKVEPISSEIKSFKLFRSELRKEGPVYTAIEEFRAEDS